MHSNLVLDAETDAFLRLGCSINAGACSNDGMPVSVRCCGCRVAVDRASLTVFVSKKQAASLLHAVGENGALAVVFSQPTTHKTLQIKGHDAVAESPTPDDLRLIAEYRMSFARELGACGYEESIVHTVLAYPSSDIVGLRFSPSELYLQTPGPKAGERLA